MLSSLPPSARVSSLQFAFRRTDGDARCRHQRHQRRQGHRRRPPRHRGHLEMSDSSPTGGVAAIEFHAVAAMIHGRRSFGFFDVQGYVEELREEKRS